MNWVALALLGGLGAVARFRLDALVQGQHNGNYPVGTFAVNITGSFALGLLTGLSMSGTWLFVAGTGFLGSFTTFSTWMFEAHRLAEDGEDSLVAMSVAIALVAGLAAAGAGWALGAAL